MSHPFELGEEFQSSNQGSSLVSDWILTFCQLDRVISRQSTEGRYLFKKRRSNKQRFQSVGWCFKPSQPQRIISGLRETVIKRYTVERTDKEEIRLEEQSEKAENCWENIWNEIQLKGP